jgi:hypothetical protein
MVRIVSSKSNVKSNEREVATGPNSESELFAEVIMQESKRYTMFLSTKVDVCNLNKFLDLSLIFALLM